MTDGERSESEPTEDGTIEPDRSRPLRAHARESALALVVVWSAEEPWRVGEVTLLRDRQRPVILGRGEDSSERLERARFLRQRPDANEPTPPLESRRISRSQLRLRSTDQALEIENIGRCPLRVRGRDVEAVSLTVGDTIELEGELLLLCAERPLRLPPLRHAPRPTHGFGDADTFGIVGESPGVWRLRDTLAFVGRRAGHVLVRGPSGAGKELVARAIHLCSERATRPLVARNAATIPSSLMDAELFGHARDYPQSGMPERAGLVGEADRSTLFLDEIGELPHELQAHLLRLMDGGEYHRLGDTAARHADVRVIAATNRSHDELKADFGARFVHALDVPPLSDRREDIPLLMRHVLRKAMAEDAVLADMFLEPRGRRAAHPRVSSALVEALVHHPLPFQVRQLESLLWQCLGASTGEWIQPVETLQTVAAPRVDPTSLTPEEIQACLDKHQGVQAKVVRELGLESRYVLRRLIRKHGLRTKIDDQDSE